jgi:hypothetical protein
MNPTRQQVYVNRTLSDYSLMMLQEDGFVADSVFPVKPVDKPTGLYFTYPRGAFNTPSMKQRAPGTPVETIDYDITNATYQTEVWALGRHIDDQIVAAADEAVNLELEATELLRLQLRLNKEINWANTYFQSGVWTSQYTGVSGSPSSNQFVQWNNSASATPIEDVRNMIRQMIQTSGNVVKKQNLVLVLGKQVYDTLLGVAEIEARIQYAVKQQGEAALVTQDVLAQLFEVSKILVSTVTQNTAAYGASENEQFVLGKSALLAYVPTTVGLRTPAAGLNFTWSKYGGGAAGTIFSYPWMLTKSTHVEIEAAYQYNLVSADLGGFFASAIA